MKSREELERSTVAPNSGADFLAEREGGFAKITPLKPLTKVWLQNRIADDSVWLGETLIVEMRFFPDLADAIVDAGFTFERNAYLN